MKPTTNMAAVDPLNSTWGLRMPSWFKRLRLDYLIHFVYYRHKRGLLRQVIRERVIKARAIQQQRFQDSKDIHANAMMSSTMAKDVCKISKVGQNLLKAATEKLGLSARAYDRILKVARTIADLADKEDIKEEHLAEAIQYCSLDREGWGG